MRKKEKVFMSYIIAVQSPLSTMEKFLKKTNFADLKVFTPLAIVSRSSRVYLSDEEASVSDVENKDLCFIHCSSQEQLSEMKQVLDDYGFSLPPFEVDLLEDEKNKDENQEQEIEDIIDSVEEESYILNRERAVDFLGRISTTAVFNQDEFDSLMDEKPDEKTHKDEVDDALSTIVDTETMSILPRMLPHESDVYALFFIPDTSYLEEAEYEGLAMMSSAYRMDIYDDNSPGTSGDIQIARTGEGRYLAVDNAMVLSAIEGIIPGHVVVACNADLDINEDDSSPTNMVAVWKVSHNWVEGLSSESAKDQIGDFLDTIASFIMEEDDEGDIKIFATQDIDIPEYPFLKQSPYTKDSTVTIVRSLEAVVQDQRDDEEE